MEKAGDGRKSHSSSLLLLHAKDSPEQQVDRRVLGLAAARRSWGKKGRKTGGVWQQLCGVWPLARPRVGEEVAGERVSPACGLMYIEISRDGGDGGALGFTLGCSRLKMKSRREKGFKNPNPCTVHAICTSPPFKFHISYNLARTLTICQVKVFRTFD